MSYVVSGLPLAPFRPFIGLSDQALADHRIIRMTADAPVGFPCRVMLADAQPGDTLLLLNYEHQPADSPYRARHAIFVNEAATQTVCFENQIPPVLTVRKAISLRAFDEHGMMIEAELAGGADLEPLVQRLLEVPRTAYLHAHNAGRGCYAARIDRA